MFHLKYVEMLRIVSVVVSWWCWTKGGTKNFCVVRYRYAWVLQERAKWNVTPLSWQPFAIISTNLNEQTVKAFAPVDTWHPVATVASLNFILVVPVQYVCWMDLIQYIRPRNIYFCKRFALVTCTNNYVARNESSWMDFAIIRYNYVRTEVFF